MHLARTYLDEIQVLLQPVLDEFLQIIDRSLNVESGEAMRRVGLSVVLRWEDIAGHVLVRHGLVLLLMLLACCVFARGLCVVSVLRVSCDT